MIWIPVLLNVLVVTPFLWTLLYPGSGPDGAMEASFTFFIGLFWTAIIWGCYGAIQLFIYLLNVWHG